ncbi:MULTISPECIES: hypothetical protein [Acidianus]|uniref:DNA-directed DNA polymerase n=1 Tax=Candidatus Acidianus copahuensis TaxID=1160895 RepID=A0A031LTM0_9CREN|nr:MULTISPECIES: hypothetical protein [Acidianus]EZQ10854.1 DNA polymerase IV [Candidatus Acidianus copahuensis]NON61244.1 DNA polymerase IV [Acidianus sp. RZ1]
MIVLFVDFDYFFAQVEEILNPELKGKPVVVCVFSGRTKDSGAVATANYIARKLGVKAGIPIIKAKELAPTAVFLPMRKEIYFQLSKRIMNILSSFSEKIEIASIDEAYLDITQKVKDYDDAVALGKKIKDYIKSREGISLTVGIAPNKVFAKIVADRSKPNGLGVVRPEEVNDFMNSLNIDEIPGIGKILQERLKEVGISRLIDVLDADLNRLEKIIGKAKSRYLISLASGTFLDPVKPRNIKHKGRYVTLGENSRELTYILPYLERAIDDAYSKSEGIPRSIAIIAIMEDLNIVSREKTFTFGISREIAKREAKKLISDILKEDNRKLRRVGVRLGKISKSSTLDKFFNL